jgi:hypothetical protein
MCSLRVIQPVLFGSIVNDSIGNFFDEGVVNKLPNIIPEATLKVVFRVLVSTNLHITDETRVLTVRGVVSRMLDKLGVRAWEFGDMKTASRHVSDIVVGHMQSHEVEESVVVAGNIPTNTSSLPEIRNDPNNTALAVDGNAKSPVGVENSLSSTVRKIREEFDLSDDVNMANVIKHAIEQLNLSDECSKLKTIKEKANLIASSLGI